MVFAGSRRSVAIRAATRHDVGGGRDDLCIGDLCRLRDHHENPATLHTPLMSGSNAISGITLVGAILSAGAGQIGFASILGMIAIVMATINVVGGFLVTNRMLAMFRRKK
jgi:NAD(P) transhydrogenase subunit alpha